MLCAQNDSSWVVSAPVVDCLNGSTPPVESSLPAVSPLPSSPQLLDEIFFQTFYKEIQKYSFSHPTIPYSFLMGRPGIEFSCTETPDGESVRINSQFVIGCIPKNTDRNYVTLNNDNSFNPKIKTLYTMFLKGESNNLLSLSTRGESLVKLSRCPEVCLLCFKARQMTATYHEVNALLLKKSVTIVPDVLRELIEGEIFELNGYNVQKLADAYQKQHNMNHTPPPCDGNQEDDPKHKPLQQPTSSCHLNAAAAEFKPQKQPPPPYCCPPPSYVSPPEPIQ